MNKLNALKKQLICLLIVVIAILFVELDSPFFDKAKSDFEIQNNNHQLLYFDRVW
ncbi:hypothetical protein [Flammeovirga sp. SJP92]|uniref:hypothetical protein n=1 Tax=Flammeovirga sp. SJP92 TaxID=1775430 RepID=UPI0012FA112B|nr:hypothetical protein [Flammeovirga sp. SJP92]